MLILGWDDQFHAIIEGKDKTLSMLSTEKAGEKRRPSDIPTHRFRRYAVNANHAEGDRYETFPTVKALLRMR